MFSGVELFQTTFAGTVHYGIFCKKSVIAKGSRFGPFQGKLVNTSEIKTNDDNSFMWEVRYQIAFSLTNFSDHAIEPNVIILPFLDLHC